MAIQASTNTKQGALLFVLLIALVIAGLIFLWKTLPSLDKEPVTQVKKDPLRELQRQCQFAGGKWIECGNPCHGSATDTACIRRCEAQCLCGGDQEYRCPKSQTCQQWAIVSTGTKPIGVCR